jgi:hypothetical protein
MSNLALIEMTLQNDSQAREQFFQDPVAYLARQGVTLSIPAQNKLRESVALTRTKAGAGMNPRLKLQVVAAYEFY